MSIRYTSKVKEGVMLSIKMAPFWVLMSQLIAIAVTMAN